MAALSAIGGLLFAAGCDTKSTSKYTDTYTTGSIRVATDHSFRPLIDCSLAAYYDAYPKAKLHIAETSEDSAMRLLALDSVQLVVASRKLNDRELEVLQKQQVKPIYTKIAVDAVTLIVNKQNPDSNFLDTEVKAILSGKLKNWSDLRKGSKTGQITCVFDNDNSSNLTFLTQYLGLKRQDLQNAKIFAAGNSDKVIAYVAEHPEAIGFVGVSQVYDSADMDAWHPKVRVCGIAKKPTADDATLGPDDYFKPYQAYIGDKSYLFRREVFWIYRDGRNGLARGYSAYMASDKGQRMMLKLGLLPANAQVRLVNLVDEPIAQ